MSLPPKPAGPPPYIANIISRLNTIKSNINNLKSQPKLVNSGKNAKIKYLDDEIVIADRMVKNFLNFYTERKQELKQEGKTDDEIKLDRGIIRYYNNLGKYNEEKRKLEEEKKAVIMSGGKTRRNKRKNRKTRKSN